MSAVPQSEQIGHRRRRRADRLIALPAMSTKPVNPSKYKRNPLRCVVSREIIRQRISWGTTILLYHEVLSCGHPNTCSPIMEADYTAHRRRCCACGEQAQTAAVQVTRRRAA